ncbi:MAG: hypothetical protein K2X62_04880 [Beijerinckiaceae bacterium]|nr:hypothetical protein [Beijerinckiaceae bacterium]
MMRSALLFLLFLFFPRAAMALDLPIPRSAPGDKGAYFLMDHQRKGDVATTLHRREGPSGVGFSRSEINCRTMKIRDLGYSEDSPTKMKISLGKWYDLVSGSSKSDLAHFACRVSAR